MTRHTLKCWPEYFQALVDGAKTFEARKDDRDPPFAVGDWLNICEFDPMKQEHTLRIVYRTVTYVLRNTEHVAPGYCILGLSR